MLRSTLTARIHALTGENVGVAPCPLPEAADYLVRLSSREQARRVADALLADGPERMRHADLVGEGFLLLTPGPRAYEAALEALAHPAPTPAAPRPRALLEYVSADPHAPLTLTHAREGVLGDALARLLAAQGHEVRREFYVNDAPGTALRGFVQAVAAKEGGAWAEAVASALGARPATPESCAQAARALQDETLKKLGVRFDGDVSESALHAGGALAATLDSLIASGHTEVRDGALWLLASRLGDDHDRVLRRPGGEATYLAGDLAYHADKLARGFERLIDLWDADHRAYVARTHAGLRALGLPAERLSVLVCGPVRVLKDGTEVRGGRYGGFVSLEEVLEEQSAPVLRWRLLRAPSETPLDLPLDAPEPLEAVLSAREAARSAAQGADRDGAPLDMEAILAHPAAATLLRRTLDLHYETQEAARTLAPHRLALYAEELATLAAAPGALQPSPRLARASAEALSAVLNLLGLDDEENSHG